MLIMNESLKPHYISHCNNPHTIIFDDHHLCVSVTGALVCGLGFCDWEKKENKGEFLLQVIS